MPIGEGGLGYGEALHFPGAGAFDALIKNDPMLPDDLQIESVRLHASVNADNLIANQAAEIILSGNDENGDVHEVVVNMNEDLSDLTAQRRIQ